MSKKSNAKRAAYAAKQEEKARKTFRNICIALAVCAVLFIGAYVYALS